MIVKLLNDEGRIIGRAEMTDVRMGYYSEQKPYIPCPPRHNETWGQFEDENLGEAFRHFVSDRALKAGRTEGAIMSRLRRFMPGTWS